MQLTQVNSIKTSSNRNRRKTKVFDIVRAPTSTVATPNMTHVIIHKASPGFTLGGMSSGEGLGGSWMLSAILLDVIVILQPRTHTENDSSSQRQDDEKEKDTQGPRRKARKQRCAWRVALVLTAASPRDVHACPVRGGSGMCINPLGIAASDIAPSWTQNWLDMGRGSRSRVDCPAMPAPRTRGVGTHPRHCGTGSL